MFIIFNFFLCINDFAGICKNRIIIRMNVRNLLEYRSFQQRHQKGFLTSVLLFIWSKAVSVYNIWNWTFLWPLICKTWVDRWNYRVHKQSECSFSCAVINFPSFFSGLVALCFNKFGQGVLAHCLVSILNIVLNISA